MDDRDHSLRTVLALCGRRPIHLLFQLSWSCHHEGSAVVLKRRITQFMAGLPAVRASVLVNTPEEEERLQGAGLSAVWVPANVFRPEAVFRPLPGVSREWDAVYDARLARFKRHDLVERVPRPAFITYDAPAHAEPGYADELRQRFRHAHWFNGASKYRRLNPDEVNAAYNRCHAGLCLSAEEGGMLASIQYLLAGLPVVTTPSIGGRDIFFDPEHVVTVEPDARAVADAVRELIALRPDPCEVRSRVLDRMVPFRERLVKLVSELRGQASPADWRPVWEEWMRTNSHNWAAGSLLDALRDTAA